MLFFSVIMERFLRLESVCALDNISLRRNIVIPPLQFHARIAQRRGADQVGSFEGRGKGGEAKKKANILHVITPNMKSELFVHDPYALIIHKG